MVSKTPYDLSAWLTGGLIPLWAARVIRPGEPGYVEYFNADGTASASRKGKTTLVTARLVYVFSHAYCLHPTEQALEAARHGLQFLLNGCRGSDGRFRHSVNPDGTAIDDRSDLYDLAFVLFALSWYYRATGERHVLDIADSLMGFIETELSHHAGGFMEDSAGSLPRRQNPHMHLLEACHALAEVSPDPRWLKRADNLVQLMRTHFYDSSSGSLGEFFDDDLKSSAGEAGRRREPGHQFEWVWLLLHHGRLTGDVSMRAIADNLFSFGSRHGFAGPLPAPAIDAVDPNGKPLESTRLLWPQTEYIKALIARSELLNDGNADQLLDSHLALIFDRYLDPNTGFWVNQLDPNNQVIAAEIPVRVLYHLFLAFAEVCRVKNKRTE